MSDNLQAALNRSERTKDGVEAFNATEPALVVVATLRKRWFPVKRRKA